jgi:HPt (histidine-containing phosphotransfer) domain-containing protein
MDDYISKPFDLESLRAALRKWYGLTAVGISKAAKPEASSEPPNPVPPDVLILDETRLAESTGGDKEFEMELFSNFLDHSQLQLNRLKVAVEANDYVTIKEISHSMKGASGALGARRLQSLSEAMEKAAQADETTCSLLAKHLADEFDDVRSLMVDRSARKAA